MIEKTMYILVKVNGFTFCLGEFVTVFVPLDLSADGRRVTEVTRMNRLLPIGHRTRGDVGVAA